MNPLDKLSAPMTDVLQLLRVSTEGQAGEDRHGLASQRRACQETARSFNLRIVSSIELVMSGADVAQTPEMDGLLRRIEEGEAVGIVVAAYDRLFRPERWSDMLILQRLHDAGASIWTPSGMIDLQTETGHIQATLYNLVASIERRRIRERMMRGKEEGRRKGQHVGGPKQLPFGLNYSKENGWAWTDDAEIVRVLFQRFLQGEGTVRLGDTFGIAPSSVAYILHNPIYTGWRVYDQKRDPSPQGKYPNGQRRRIAREASEIIRVRLPLEAIVSEGDHLAVQAMLERGRLRSARAKAQTHSMFTYQGVLVCHRCGQPCYARRSGAYKNGSPKGFYFCKSRSPRHEGECCGARYMSYHRLEGVLDKTLTRRLTSRRFLSRALKAHERAQKSQGAHPDPVVIQRKIRAVEAKRSRIVDAFVDGLIEKPERNRRLALLENERLRIKALEAEAPAPGVITAEHLAGVFSVFAEWKYLSFESRREILQALSPRIYVDAYEAHGLWLPGDVLGDSRNSHFPKADRSITSPGGLYLPLAA